MQCPICHFENMPKSLYCARCAAQLYIESGHTEDYLPPRASRWKKWRILKYLYNRISDLYNYGNKVPLERTKSLPFASTTSMFLSLFPGLGHLAYGNKKHFFLSFSIWTILLIATIFLYGSFAGNLSLAMILFWHCIVVFHAGEIRKHYRTILYRLAAMIFIFAVLASGYLNIVRSIEQSFKVVISPHAYKYFYIEKNDSLLVQKTTPNKLYAGDLVALTPGKSGNMLLHSGLYIHIPEFVIGRVVATAGSHVKISKSGIWVDGNCLSSKTISLERLTLPKVPYSFKVPKNHILVPMINTHIPENSIVHVWKKIYIFPLKDIWGKPIAIYFPLSKRYFFGGDHHE